MKSPLFQTTTLNGATSADVAGMTFADPWEALGEGREKRDNWLMSYIDILTLFLTLFVVLLALQPKNEAPPVDANPGEIRFVSPEPIERQTAPPTLSVQTEPRQADEMIEVVPGQQDITDSAGHRETGSDTAQLFSVFALQAESVASLIYLPAVESSAPADSLSPPKSLESASNPSEHLTDADESTKAAESAQPLPPENSRDQVQRFMAKLEQQQLDDRVRVSEVAEGVYLEVNDNILFALGSAELKRDGATLLGELALLLFEHQGIVSVEGHTDDRPIATNRFPSNWELSSGRATTVTRYLIGKGMDPARLRAVGYADTRPLESNSTIEGRARNRRVALIVEIPEV